MEEQNRNIMKDSYNTITGTGQYLTLGGTTSSNMVWSNGSHSTLGGWTTITADMKREADLTLKFKDSNLSDEQFYKKVAKLKSYLERKGWSVESIDTNITK